MPGVIDALAASGTPFSVLTKGTLLRRDLPLLQAAAAQVPVGVGVSLAVHDDEPAAPARTGHSQRRRAARAWCAPSARPGCRAGCSWRPCCRRSPTGSRTSITPWRRSPRPAPPG
ncbi:hypothetical protein GCM10025868_04180 [Angustibacter aerolatus]|uniref:Uncharacterized protein n=1 Tax=Angustibacter aerolatus TaxID=1162965 RepID=A0ABQ6JAG8_9ACTN|nr:hypothetical protein GCM10025868_04180 [Angustibacter aerolatus]